MSWSSTQTWWHTIHTVVDEIERRCDGTLPWKPEYADTFPDPASLHLALQYFWSLEVAAQADQHRDTDPREKRSPFGSRKYRATKTGRTRDQIPWTTHGAGHQPLREPTVPRRRRRGHLVVPLPPSAGRSRCSSHPRQPASRGPANRVAGLA